MRHSRGSTMLITLVVVGILSLIGTTLVTSFRTELSITQARQFLSEARENAEQGLRAFMDISSDTVLQPGVVQADMTLNSLPTAASATSSVALLHTDGANVRLQVRELFCGDEGSTGTGSMLGTGAKRVWFNIESDVLDPATQARAQINLGASRIAPPNACNY